jgi:glycine cleavage system H protein
LVAVNVPADLRYSKDHEWARLEGTVVAAGDSFGEVESTKSVSDLYAPVSGTVIETNDVLADAPERLNDDPYGEGWICLIEPDDPSQLEALLDAAAYRTLIDS